MMMCLFNMAGKPSVWTPAKDAVIVEMAASASHWRPVADALGVSVFSAKARGARLGVFLRPENVADYRRECLQINASTPEAVTKRAKSNAATWTDERRRLFSQYAINNSSVLHTRKVDRATFEARRVAAIRAAKLRCFAWCPEYLREEYKKLTHRHGKLYAKGVIGDEWLRDLRRAFRAIAVVAKPLHEEQRRQYRSFEAELERAKTRGIREVVHLHKPEFHLSLTGGSLS